MGHGDWKDMFKGVQQNDIDLVVCHIKLGIDLNYQHPEFMTTPLIESIRNNNTEMMILLLKNGASPKVVEVWSNQSPFSIASEISNEEALNILKTFL